MMNRASSLRKMVAITAASALLFTAAPYAIVQGQEDGSALDTATTTKPFHIGIFNPPAPENVNAATYAEIADMNVNFIVGGNSHYYYGVNKRALDLAEQNGLKILVTDARFGWDEPTIEQTAGDTPVIVNQSAPWGQTFESPNRGTDWGLNYVSLNLDQANWPAGATLTLSLYDSPAKGNLIASASVGTPATPVNEPTIFWLLTRVYMGTQYYMELTSDSANNITLLLNEDDPYAGGEAYQNGVAESGSDLWFTALFSESVFKNGGGPSLETLEDIVEDYGDHPALMGYNLYDEPSATLFPSLGNMVRTLRDLQNPEGISLVNLWPSDAAVSQTGMNENRDGSVLNSSSTVGQTFTTKPYETEIRTVQWFIPSDQWQAGEGVTLRLWDSPAQNTLLAEDYLSSAAPGKNNQTFELNADVDPNTSYYMELVHNGGGDNFFGVWRSASGIDWYHGGEAYANGQPLNADFWYAINQDIEPFSYEDHVNRWVRTDPDVVLFDYYPYYYNGTVSGEFYNNLEIVRRQALAGELDFWTFVQSVGIGTWLRPPTQNDMRHNIYTNLAYGSKGLIYFTYWHPVYDGFVDSIINPSGNQNPSYGWARDLNAEVLNLGDTLNRLESVAVYHTGAVPPHTEQLPSSYFWQPDDLDDSWIISAFKDENGRDYMMVVNRDVGQSQAGTFTLGTKPGKVSEVSKTTGLEVSTGYSHATGIFSATFLPGEGKLYAIDAEPDDYAPLAQDQQINVLQNHAAGGMLQAEDAENQPLAYTIVANGAKGTAAITNAATGAFTYTPNAGATGTDTFTFLANDGIQDSAVATVTVHITPELAITVAPGAAAGSTRLSATVASGHTLAVSLEDAAIPVPAVGVAAPDGTNEATPYATHLDLSGAAAGQHIAAYELDSQGRVVKFATAVLQASHIKAASGGNGGGIIYVPVPNPGTGTGPMEPGGNGGEGNNGAGNGPGDGSGNGNGGDNGNGNGNGNGVGNGNGNGNGNGIAPGQLQELADVQGHWAYASIKDAVERGIVNGYKDGTFKPAKLVSRAELVVMLMRALPGDAVEPSVVFADQQRIGGWAQQAINRAVQLGYVQGYADNSFRPDEHVTRQQLAVMLGRIMGDESQPEAYVAGINDEASIAGWARQAVFSAVGKELIALQDEARFNPQGFVSRADAVTIIMNVLRLLEG